MSICLLEHKTRFIVIAICLFFKRRQILIFSRNFQPLLPMVSSQHTCIKQWSASGVKAQQRSLNCLWGNTLLAFCIIQEVSCNVVVHQFPDHISATIIHLCHLWHVVLYIWKLADFTWQEFQWSWPPRRLINKSVSLLCQRLKCFHVSQHTLYTLYFNVLPTSFCDCLFQVTLKVGSGHINVTGQYIMHHVFIFHGN